MAGLIRAASRFQEGSMNDRVSAAPPLEIIGHCQPRSHCSQTDDDDLDDIAAEFLSGYSPRKMAATVHNTNNLARIIHSNTQSTTSSHGTMGKNKGDKRNSFLPSIWTGLREKLNFKKTEGKQRPRSNHSSAQHHSSAVSTVSSGSTPEPIPPMPTSPLLGMGMGDNGVRPSRDEVMANYKTLMAQGFFGTHAIQSTRRPPPKPLNTSQSVANFKPSGPPTDGLRSNPVPPTPTSIGLPSPSWRAPIATRPVSSPMDKNCLAGWDDDANNSRGMKRSGRDSPDADITIPTHKKLRKSASRIGDFGKLRRRGSELTGLFTGRSTQTPAVHAHSKSVSSVPSAPIHSPTSPNFSRPQPSPNFSRPSPTFFPPHPAIPRPMTSSAISPPLPSPRLKKRPTMSSISGPLTPPIHMRPGAFEAMQSTGFPVDASLVSEHLPVEAIPLWEAQSRMSQRSPVAVGHMASVPMDLDGVVREGRAGFI